MGDFAQCDLDEEDVMLLDTWEEVRGQRCCWVADFSTLIVCPALTRLTWPLLAFPLLWNKSCVFPFVLVTVVCVCLVPAPVPFRCISSLNTLVWSLPAFVTLVLLN